MSFATKKMKKSMYFSLFVIFNESLSPISNLMTKKWKKLILGSK